MELLVNIIMVLYFLLLLRTLKFSETDYAVKFPED